MKVAEAHQENFGTALLPEAEPNSVQEGQDFPVAIATMPATERQRNVAVAIAIFLIVAAVVIAPFASIQLGRIDAFIPVLQTVVSVVDLITARSSLSAPFSRWRVVTYSAARSRSCRRWPFRAGTPRRV
jgi:hypothetical protein